jgi:hypothetical protein
VQQNILPCLGFRFFTATIQHFAAQELELVSFVFIERFSALRKSMRASKLHARV